MSVSDVYGMACPACKSDKNLSVAATKWVSLTEDGTDDSGSDVEWSDASDCCCRCGWQGKAGDAVIAG